MTNPPPFSRSPISSLTMSVPSPRPWQIATVTKVRTETPTAMTLRLSLPEPFDYLPGQHCVVRLTAPGGYRAQRSYSIATAPGGAEIELTVELLAGGEVSGFIHAEVRAGDTLEIRGPIGGHFAWNMRSPALCIAGGSGVVPLMAMLRTARQQGHPNLINLVVSTRSPDRLFYRDEIGGPQTIVFYTRHAPRCYPRPVGRIDTATLESVSIKKDTFFVCGSAAFCDHATALLSELDISPERIKVERFGPTG